MSDLKIILLCSSRFALPALKELAFLGLLAAVAIPRHCDELTENVQIGLAGSGIPVVSLDKETFVDQIAEAIQKYEATLGLVMSFSYKIPASLYKLPAKGFYNVHPGPLPKYRGADPIFQQIKNREKQAGVTIHKLADGMDTGAVVIQEMVKLNPADTYGMLTTKLANIAARLAGILLKLLVFEIPIPSRPQDETQAHYFKRQTARDITVNWLIMDADSIVALVNACNPWNKGAVAKINNQLIRLLEVEKLPEHTFLQKEPGYVIALDDTGIMVSTIKEQAINIKMIYAEEGFLPASRLRYFGVRVGNRFEKIE